MSTTTIKLPDDLKERIAAAAADAGKTPHAFMVEALAAQTALAERRRAKKWGQTRLMPAR